MPEYMEIRRSVSGFLELCKTPDLAARVTLLPVEKLGVDAAILFSDILVPIEAMGVPVEFLEGEGPRLGCRVEFMEDVEALRVPDPVTSMDFVLETVREAKERLAGEVPLIGFSGAPFTLASYMLEGGSSRNYLKTKTLMYNQPRVFQALMEKLTATVIAYLKAQVEAGADAVQLFDSWVGALSPCDFKEYVILYNREIIEKVKATGVPFIFFGTDTAALLPQIAGMGADVISVDWRIELSGAIKIVRNRAAIQGNLDPCALFMPQEVLQERVAEILRQGRKARGHIFNLGHGVLAQTDPEMVKFLVDTVHTLSRR